MLNLSQKKGLSTHGLDVQFFMKEFIHVKLVHLGIECGETHRRGVKHK